MTHNPFITTPPPPVRVRFEAATVSRDVVVPAALVVYPDPTNPETIEILEQHGNHGQIVLLVASVIRWATATGLMDLVMRSLLQSPSQGHINDLGTQPPPNTPQDDIPPHLRRAPSAPPPKPTEP